MTIRQTKHAVRRMSPPRFEIDRLRTALTQGETRVLDLLDEALPSDWELYLQPHMNGLRPDFVLLSPIRGVATIEVKDWANPDLRDLKAAADKVRVYEGELEDLYCPTLRERAGDLFGSRSARLVLSQLTRAALRTIWPDAPGRFVVCSDELSHVEKLVPGAFVTCGDVAKAAVDDLRSWLEEPRVASEQRTPLLEELNPRQRTLVRESPGASGLRRVKGAAGSGKSLVLAARAAHLVKLEAKRGLVTSYNITLLHYLRDLAVRYPRPERNALLNEHVVWLHFHAWCKRICSDAGLRPEYDRLWYEVREGRLRPDQVLDVKVPELTRDALKVQSPNYDFILVDEGQDWHLDWWKTLQSALRAGGEMMLVADRTQDVYGRGSKWTDEAMTGAGFRGPWASLDVCYRLPAPLIPVIREFATTFIQTDVHLPEIQPQAELWPSVAKWLHVENGEEPDACADVIEKLHRGDILPSRVSPPDIILVVQDKKTGSRCVDVLASRGYEVCHTFSEDDREEKRLKQAFYRGDARVKATTYQSYKGFENSVVVVLITSAGGNDCRGIYAALTRVKRHPEGSALVVVNSTASLRGFGTSWEAGQN